MIKVVNRNATPQSFIVTGPAILTPLCVSAPLERYSTTQCDLELASSERLMVVNATDDYADGYVLVFYI
jgi:hypothetical protein